MASPSVPDAIVASAVLMLCSAGAQAAEPGGSLVSPMVDRSIFRDGQVSRLSGRFQDWTLTCDEIGGLKRRYCSLRSAAVADDRGRPVYVDVSTGDDGRPAGLLHLPLTISIRNGVIVRAGTEGRRAAKAAGAATRTIAICDSRECLAVWTLSGDEIAALRDGRGVRLSYCSVGPTVAEFRPSLANTTCEMRSKVAISGEGFEAAITASMK